MKNNYELDNRCWLYAFAIFLIILFSPFHQALAQQDSDVISGVLRLKVSEEMAAQLENATISRQADGAISTGIQSLDRVGDPFGMKGITRVFRSAGKNEAKHRAHGLHLWFQVDIDPAQSVIGAIGAFRSIDDVTLSEPVFKKNILGSDHKNFGSIPIAPDEINKRSTATLPGASNDPLLVDQWHYNNTGQSGGTPGVDIKLLQAWGIETGSPDVIVAVTDGGIQVDHPDLAGNMWVNTAEIPDNGIDDDDNGYIDDINGYSFVDNSGDIAPDDHGTHVGGTIAATTNNGLGVAGVAGGSGDGDGVRLMSCATFNDITAGGFADSYVYAADNGAVISQNSWGYNNPGFVEQAVLDGIDYFIAEAGFDEFGNQTGPMAGGIVIIAAGNNDADGAWYPGYYEPTLAVSATNHEDMKSWYSNYGSWVDIAAPGGETFVPNDEKGVLSTLANGQYGFFQGTSMACPHVSGVAALIISQYGGSGFPPTFVWNRLVNTTDNIDAIDTEFSGLLGSGRLNAFSALQSNDGTPPDAIADLSAFDVGITYASLTWTSPVDEDNGSASIYDIRYATSPITELNFDAATAVTNPPFPSIAGAIDSVTIQGLAPGTVYYFAIKALDFFGNASGISNVLEQSTNLPPTISISSTLLSDNLLTAQTAVQSILVSNTGFGPLDFAIDKAGPDDFASLSASSGTVASGSSLSIDITFDANGLFTGVYTQDLLFISNDPINTIDTVSLILNVSNNGAPIASFDPADSVALGVVFIGATSSETVTISNSGSDTLNILSTTITNPAFSTSLTEAVTIPPFSTYPLDVYFSPSSLGYTEGLLSVYSNTMNAPYELTVDGFGIPAPDVAIAPDSLYETLFIDHASVQSLTISNTGDSDLEFSIEASAVASGDPLSTLQVVLPTTSAGPDISNNLHKSTASTTKFRQSTVDIQWVNQSAATSTVLIVTPDSNVSDLAALLNGFPDVSADIYPQTSLPELSLNDLLTYDVVMTTNNTQWLGSGGINPSAIGDLLADYIDAGGKVIVNQFAYSYDAWQMEGRFIDDTYGPFLPSTTDAVVSVALGSIPNPDHPIVQGVSSLNYSGYVQNVGLAPEAIALANWSNDELFLAANPNVVALNVLPDLGDGQPLQWDGDLALIYHNAIQFLKRDTFLSFSLDEGTLAIGESVSVEVTFDASGLNAGLYEGLIDITTNVPGKESVFIPASLTVTGPEFSISPDSVAAVLEKNQSTTQVITLTNNGDGSYPFTVDVTNAQAVANMTFSTTTLSNAASTMSKGQLPVPSEMRSQTTPFTGSLSDTKSIIGNTASETVIRSRLNGTLEATQSSEVQYATGFEEFILGDISAQNGWIGSFGNWTIESTLPKSGSQHFQGLSDGFGFSQAFSPYVGIGSDEVSSTSMSVNLLGVGTTWQVVPQSPTAGFIVTRLQFSDDGVMRVLVDDGFGGGIFLDIPVSIPSGYFDIGIEVIRATAEFTIIINGEEVFFGQGFAGDIEEVVVLSLMEVVGSTLDVDEFQIIDGSLELLPDFVSVSPLSGTLGAGESIELTVSFDATDLEFGKYSASVEVAIADQEFSLPAFLHVVGDPEIAVSPTVIQAVVPYKEDTVHLVSVENTGGYPLDYSIQVIGADTDIASLPVSPERQSADWKTDKRILQKLALEAKNSPEKQNKPDQPTVLQLLAGMALLEENFEGGSFPPAGWNVVDNEGTGVVWGFAADYGEGNYAGTGEVATVSSDAVGFIEYDAELITPEINTQGYKNVAVQYNANYANFGTDVLELDILIAGDSSWTTVLSWNEDHGTFFGTGEQVIVELDDYLGSATSFQLRWHYYNPSANDWDWYAQIDDVVVLGDPRAWLSMYPSSGSVPVGESVSVEARFDSEDIEPGFYVAGAIVTSNAVSTPTVGLLASLDVLEPAEISIAPDSIYQELMKGESTEMTISISNTGVSPLKYSFDGYLPARATSKIQDRISPITTRSAYTESSEMYTDARAIPHNSTSRSASTTVYGTGFEEFFTGDINGQENWLGEWGNWNVEAINAFEGAQHFRGLSDGFGQSLAFSPNVGIGSEEISSTTMMVNIEGTDVTWQIIPQSTTAELVVTRFAVNPDMTLSTLVSDSVGNASYVDISASLPSGYFEFRLDVNRATSEFTIYFDQIPVFTGQGFGGDIEEMAILSLMESAGPTMDIDDLVIWDGAPTKPWLTLDPTSGVIPSGTTADISVLLDATDLDKGLYTQTLYLMNNDPESTLIQVPVLLDVDENLPPELTMIQDTSAVELGELSLNFTATDPDDSLLFVTLVNPPSFATLTAEMNGSTSYSFSPQIGDAGTYELIILAEDGRGLTDSTSVSLSVIPFGVESFSLVNRFTSEIVTTFTDSLTLDVNDPDFFTYVIQANTNSEKVGSVKFTIDNKRGTLDSRSPYYMKPVVTLGLTGGPHDFSAKAYTRKKGKGKAGQEKHATLSIVNSAAVTGAQIVSRRGRVLMELTDGSIIDSQDPDFKSISIAATTEGPVSKVVFELNGKITGVDYLAPYSMKGNLFGCFGKRGPKPGKYTLTVTPYSGYHASVAGKSLTIAFEISSDSNLRVATEAPSELLKEASIVLFPVPTQDVITIQATELPKGKTELILFNLQGKILYRESVLPNQLKGKQLSLESLGLSNGVYYLKVQGGGTQFIREIIKK